MSRPRPAGQRAPTVSSRAGVVPLAGTALLVSFVLLACGGAASQSPAPTPTLTAVATPTPEATAEPTPTPEPTPDIEALGAQYLAYVAAFAGAQGEASAAVDAATSDEEASAAYELYVAANAAAIEDLSRIDLPADLAAHQDAMIEAITTVKEVYEQLVIDPQDPDPTIDTRLQDAVAIVFEAGSAIREALGLPPPTTPAPE
jgi:hypothetical protein